MRNSLLNPGFSNIMKSNYGALKAGAMGASLDELNTRNGGREDLVRVRSAVGARNLRGRACQNPYSYKAKSKVERP